MQLSVLGPVRLTGLGGAVSTGDRKTRQVLTLLALVAPRPFSVDALVRLLWDDPPASAIKTVQAHVSRLRSALLRAGGRPGVLSGSPAGYQIAPGVDELDVQIVDSLRRRARIATLDGDDHGAARLLQRARHIWRGDPELPATAAGDAEAARLAEEHLSLVVDHLTAVIHTDRPGDALPELEALCAGRPLQERLHALRVTTLYRQGRQADALQAYRAVRRRLVDELGVEPGPELRAAERAALAHAPRRPRTEARRVEPTIAIDVPHYAHRDGVHVAYGTYGNGPVDVLLLDPTFIPVDAYLEEPHLADAMIRLADGRRVIALEAGLRDVVAGIAAPDLLLSRTGCASNDPGHSRYLTERLPNATLVEHDDPDGPWFLGDVGWVLAQFTAFVARPSPQAGTTTRVPRTGELRP